MDSDGYVLAPNENEETLPHSICHGVIWIEVDTDSYFEDALLRAKEVISQNLGSKPSVAYLSGEYTKSESSDFHEANSFNGAEADIVCYKVGKDSNFIQNCCRARRLLILITDKNSKPRIVELLQNAVLGENPIVHQIEIQGADPNFKDEKGETALHLASNNGRLDVIKHLIAKGADPKLKDHNGKTAYDLALDKAHGFENFRKVLDYLVPFTPNITFPNSFGQTALYTASAWGCFEAVKHLIANGADPNLKNGKGEAALHIASYWGELEIVKHLMANGADQKLKDNNGKTAYDMAKDGCVHSSWMEINCKQVMHYLQRLPQN